MVSVILLVPSSRLCQVLRLLLPTWVCDCLDCCRNTLLMALDLNNVLQELFADVSVLSDEGKARAESLKQKGKAATDLSVAGQEVG